MITASGMEEMGYQAFVVSEAGLIDELLLGSHELMFQLMDVNQWSSTRHAWMIMDAVGRLNFPVEAEVRYAVTWNHAKVPPTGLGRCKLLTICPLHPLA